MTERIHARVAFLSGANAALWVAKRAKAQGGGRAVLQALRDLRKDLKREAGQRRTPPRKPQSKG